MKVQARLNNYRSSARKVRAVAPVIKDLDVVEAEWQLENMKKGCAKDLKKLLLSAVSNAQNNHGLDKKNLIVSELMVQEGRVLKRWMPRAHGRATPILKRSCHVILAVKEKEEGKGRKKIAKPAKRDQAKAREGKTKKHNDGQVEVKDKQPEREVGPVAKEERKVKDAAARKIFRRKSF